MRIAYLEIENFRGIKSLEWAPSPGMNCLIGPGDSTKTTILDAIELCLNPRSYTFADDCDFFDLDIDREVRIVVTFVDLPSEFKAEDRYGLHLRGWNRERKIVEDEPGAGLEEALSVVVTIDRSLEARWSIHNDRIDPGDRDAPSVRYRDAQRFATNRLGPYADRHLGWGRSSILTRIGEASESHGLQLATAARAARAAFRASEQSVFQKTVERAEQLGKRFAVPVRDKYSAELDVQGVSITSGGIALHDGSLPLRRLGTGSSRLIVAALQHDAGPLHITIIDEIEHGLEPHRIARLLKYLKAPNEQAEAGEPQIFLTTHSPVVIQEMVASDIFTVVYTAGTTRVLSVSATARDLDAAQRHLRGTPEAFLARKVIVGEGRTEQGLARGFDFWWSATGRASFALQGAIAVDGGGKDKAPFLAQHLVDLGYSVFLLLDTDVALNDEAIKAAIDKGCAVAKWPDNCSTEERIFVDLPWEAVRELVAYAVECVGDDSVLAITNNTLKMLELSQITDLTLPQTLNTHQFRRALGIAAKSKGGSWFKDISRGEKVAALIAPRLNEITETPLAATLSALRSWVDE
jgi:putative ATP-dependent endonuclease of OLD family